MSNHTPPTDTIPLIPLQTILEPDLHGDVLPGMEWL